MHLFKTGKLHRAAAAFMVFVLCFIFEAAFVPSKAKAEDNLLGDASWQFLFAAPMATVTGIIQSICVTDYYIITIENVADSADTLDIVSAYYRWSSDEYGNPVQQYSLAKRVQSEEWEHGNSMCYNPNTGEIYVALYTNTKPENRGSLYVMDPQTLTKTRTIKLTSNFNFLAIAYDEVNNIYYTQTNADTGYSILVFDENFSIMANYGPEDPSPGYNFQDFCLTGDHLLEFPLTFGMDIGEYMMAYSLSSRSVVDTIPLSFGYDGSTKVEPESIKVLDDSGFIVAVNVTFADGSSQCEFYRAEFPNLGLTSSENETADTSEAASGQAVSDGQAGTRTESETEADAKEDEGVHGNEAAGTNMTTSQEEQESEAEQSGKEQAASDEQSTAEEQTPSNEQSEAEEKTPANEKSAAEEQTPANEKSTAEEQTPVNEQKKAEEKAPANEKSTAEEQTPANEQNKAEEQTPANEQNAAEEKTPENEQNAAVEQTQSNEQSAEQEQAAPSEQSAAQDQTAASEQSAAEDQPAASEQSAAEDQPAASEQNAAEEQTVAEQRAETDAYGAPKEADEDGKKRGLWVVVVILAILLALIAVFLYWQHIRRERLKREARMRKARRIMLANMAKEAEQYDDLSDYKLLEKYK